MKSDKRILITGASGFIGSHLLRILVSMDRNVHIIVRSSNFWRIRDVIHETHVHFVDLTDHKRLCRVISDIKPHIVYHLAAYGVNYNQKDTQTLFKVNVSATMSLLEALSKCDVHKLIVCGSCFEYGDISGIITQKTPPDPVSIYGASKTVEVMVTKIIAKISGIPYVVCRPFGVYGPYEPPDRIIPYTFISIIDGKPLKYTGGKQIRDYTYVGDVASALVKAAGVKEKSLEVNICSNEPIRLKKLVSTAMKIAGSRQKAEWGAIPYRADESRSLVGDNSATKKFLHWEPSVPLEEGLEKTYRWFKENKGLYRDVHVRP